MKMWIGNFWMRNFDSWLGYQENILNYIPHMVLFKKNSNVSRTNIMILLFLVLVLLMFHVLSLFRSESWKIKSIDLIRQPFISGWGIFWWGVNFLLFSFLWWFPLYIDHTSRSLDNQLVDLEPIDEVQPFFKHHPDHFVYFELHDDDFQSLMDEYLFW